MTDPRRVYSQLLQECRAGIARREERHRALGYLQLACALAALAIVWVALAWRASSIVWVFVPAAAFTALLIVHGRLLRALELRRRAARYFEKALARLDGAWPGTGEPGDRYLDPAHPYAQDLDLFGKGSLFELLSTARTHIGEETLARWLLAPAAPADVRARQEAVAELQPRVDLREHLAVLAEEARAGVDPVSLAEWGEAPALLESGKYRVLLWLLTAVGLLGFAAVWVLAFNAGHVLALSSRAAALSRDLLLLALLANRWFYYRTRKQVDAVVAAVEEAAHELGLISGILQRLERERFQSALLARLRASLDCEREPPSKRLARLNRLLDLLDSRENIFVRVLELFILWTPHLALKVEDWRRHAGPAVRRWLTATGEIEALCSLACHAFEHPADLFPELIGEPASGLLEAEAIGHPLIPEDRMVRNDVRIGDGLRLLVVSGSNMSGKSTLLRTIGVNAVLAQAGATVRARRLRLSPLAVGASIRVVDSLQAGTSRFYAEILRLRQILEATRGPLPVLFLIDEFLHGTNSHDRRIGAEALVRSLVERGAMGLITTHDLALADIVPTLDGRAANVHFEDRIEDGRMRFDYVMRPGVVRKSNTIELMRSVGLEI